MTSAKDIVEREKRYVEFVDRVRQPGVLNVPVRRGRVGTEKVWMIYYVDVFAESARQNSDDLIHWLKHQGWREHNTAAYYYKRR